MTLRLETPVQEMTVNVPQDLDAGKRLRLAVALFDAQLLTQGQAAEMAGLSRVAFHDALADAGVTPFQYSWEEALDDAERAAWADRQTEPQADQTGHQDGAESQTSASADSEE